MASAALGLPLLSATAHAGRQVEEPLMDSVRSALSSAIHQSAPPAPVFASDAARQLYAYWLVAMTERLRKRRADALEHREF